MKYSLIVLFLMSFPCLYGQQENSFKEESSLRLSQSKLSDRIYGVGEYKHFKNNFEFMKQNFLKLEVFVGILEHYDFMTADRLLKYSYGAKLNAQLSSKSLLYISGQYISNPFSSIYENTRIPMDPLFPTSGISFGIDFQLKNNINLDIGNKTLLPNEDTSIFNPTPLNMTRAKLKIGF